MTINNFVHLSSQFDRIMNANVEELLKFYPLLKDEQQDRIIISISGKRFIVQNRHVRKRISIKIKDFV